MSIDAESSVLVVIPTLNEESHLAGVVESIGADWSAASRVTLVVADGGSTDATRAVFDRLAVSRPWMHWLDNPKRIQSAAVNLAVKVYGDDADILVRCDAHAVYPAAFVRRLVDALVCNSADAVVVPMDSAGETCLQRAVAWVSDSPAGSGGSAHRGGRRSGFVDHGHHAAFKLASFRAAGGYDESFTHNEDAELDCRQRSYGSRIYLDADIRLTYRPRSTLRALWRQYFSYGRGRSRTVRKHPGSLRARQLAVPVHVALMALCFLMAAWWPVALAWPALYVGVMALVSVQLVFKHRSACGLLGGIAGACMHVSWALGFLSGLLLVREQRWLPVVADRAPAPAQALDVMLVDPSLFTAPYNAALTGGLIAAGVNPSWATRPTRPGDRQEMPLARTDTFFYRHVDGAAWIPAPLRTVVKGLSHALGLSQLVVKVLVRRPDVVHIQWVVVPPLDVLAMAVIRWFRPIVFTMHDTVPFNGQRMSLFQRAGHWLPVRLAHKVIVHTRSGRQALLNQGVDEAKIAVIPHGPLALGVPLAPTPGPRDPRWTFVLFGEIKPYKGLDLLIEAFDLLTPAQRAAARVIVAGRPRMDIAPLRERIAALGLEAQFDLRTERQSEAQMATLFADADCFLFPYRQVDASGVYFLVKSLGKWLIASRVGIFAEDMEQGVDGDLVTGGDVAMLAATLAAAIERRPAGRPFRSHEDSWLDIGRTTKQLYLSLLPGAVPVTAPSEVISGD